MYKIVIFASGTGSNARAIMNFFKNNKRVEISCILTNNPKAGVLKIAENEQIPARVFNREIFYKSDEILDFLQEINPDLIVLAGFMWLLPQNLVQYFEGKIINIHPALLPKYGGKGMYGNNVHKAVLENKERETGITIHYVNEKYDEGKIIAQHKLLVTPDETMDSLVEKIHRLEHENYPKVIQQLLFDE